MTDVSAETFLTNSKNINVSKSSNLQIKSILLEGLSGGLSGLFAYSTTFPLDVIQTRLQSTIDNDRIKNLKSIELKLKYVPEIKFQIRNKYFAVGRDIMIKDGWKGFFKVIQNFINFFDFIILGIFTSYNRNISI